MALWAPKEERLVKKHIKSYKNLYNQLFEIEKVSNSVVDELKKVTFSQLQVHIADIKIACVLIDRAMEQYASEKPELYQRFFNEIPKYSTFDKGADYISEESTMHVLPTQSYSEKDLKLLENNLKVLERIKASFERKVRFYNFTHKKDLNFIFSSDQNNNHESIIEAVKEEKFPPTLKGLLLWDLKKINDIYEYFYNFFYKTQEMLYNNFVFENLPIEFSPENFKLHSTIQFFVENGIISKDNPFKSPIFDMPDILKDYASEIGLFNVDLNKKKA